MNSLIQDMRLAFLRLRSKPGHLAVVSMILALGIGASTAIFTLVDATLFHPFDLPEADRLVRLDEVNTPAERADPKTHSNSSYPTFDDYRAETAIFTGLAAYSDTNALNVAEGEGRAIRVNGALVTGNYFDVLGARASYGRVLGAADDVTRGGHPVAVLSDGLSRRLFGGPDPSGRSIRVNGHAFTAVGAMAADFVGVSLDARPAIWIPMTMHSIAVPEFSVPRPGQPFIDALDNRHMIWLDVVGRLAPGVTLEQAQSRLDVLAQHRASAPGGNEEPFPALVPAKDAAIDFGGPNESRKLSWLLLGVVGLLLVLACADAASLQLAHGDGRRAEIATKAALGASRSQLLRQLLAESLVTSLFASTLGLMIASGVRQALIASMPEGFGIPMAMAASVLTLRPVLVASGLAFAVTVLFGLMPALRSSRADLVGALRTVNSAGSPKSRLRDSLVVMQVALSAILLVGAGLLLHSLARAASTKPGFVVENGFVARVDLARQGYTEERGAAFYDALLRDAASIPGLKSIALSRHIPVQRSGMRVTASIPGYVPKPKENMSLDYTMVSPGFFSTLGAPIVRGRDFDAHDLKGGAPVAIVNEAFVRKYFATREPLGTALTDVGIFSTPLQIVGIAPDMKLRTLREEPRPAIYVALAQAYMPTMGMIVRTTTSPASVIPALNEVVARLDKDLPLYGVTTLDAQLGVAVDRERALAILLTSFSLLAVVLAAFGLGALVFHQAQSRAREFGVRLALGARPRAVLKLVLGRSVRLSAVGVALGLAGALLLSPVVESLLFEVKPLDPATFIGVLFGLGLVTLVAAAFPAWRASHTNPATVLRSE